MNAPTLDCPTNIRALLDVYVYGEVEHPERGSVQIALKSLRDCGAIEHGEGGLQTTDLGKAWVKALCQMPAPRAAYLDQTGKEIQ